MRDNKKGTAQCRPIDARIIPQIAQKCNYFAVLSGSGGYEVLADLADADLAKSPAVTGVIPPLRFARPLDGDEGISSAVTTPAGQP